MPEELIFPMVLQLITNSGEHIAMVSPGDGRLSNTLIQMDRKPVFTDLDAEGMCGGHIFEVGFPVDDYKLDGWAFSCSQVCHRATVFCLYC